MPNLKGSINTTEGNKCLAIVHDIIYLKRYIEEVNTILSQLNNECTQVTDSLLNDWFKKHTHTLKYINSLMSTKVNAITTNMNCKTAVHVVYTNESTKLNKESQILKTQGVVIPHKKKLDFTDISTDNQLALTTTYRVIVLYKKSKINSVTPNKSQVRSRALTTKSVSCSKFPTPTNSKYYTLLKAVTVFEKHHPKNTLRKFYRDAVNQTPS